VAGYDGSFWRSALAKASSAAGANGLALYREECWTKRWEFSGLRTTTLT
jgi:hypothetical protein